MSESAAGFGDRPPFRMGEVDVRPASNEVVIGGTVVRLKPRLMAVLLRLAAAPGEVVTRETLLAEAWSRRMVNDEVLSRVIADLRQVLGDDARDARYIETLPKVGYRLVAPITPVESMASPAPGQRKLPARARWAVAAAALAGILVLALLIRATGDGADRAGLTRQLAAAEPFSSDVELEVAPRFSPDGTRIAFARGDNGRSRIVVRDVASKTRVEIGNAADLNLSPVFFPDGTRIAFYHRAPSGECEILAHDLASGEEQRLVGCVRRPQPRFDISPDGRTLLFVGVIRADFPAGLVARDIASGDERVVTSPDPDSGDDLHPRYSPDGSRIAFFRGTQSHRELWLVDAGKGAVARSAGSPRGLSYGAAWLGARGPLLVAADWFGQRSLNVLAPDSGAATAVGARGARFPDVDRAGNIVFENAIYSANLFLVDRASPDAAPRVFWPSMRYTNQPEFSPDGSRVLFVSNRDGVGGIYVATLDAPAQRIAPSDDYLYLRPHWSLDGRSIYAIRANRREDGSRAQQAIRIGIPSGEVEVFTALGDSIFDVREDPGGGFIVGELAGNAARIMRSDRLDAPGQRLALPMASEYQVAGTRIAFMQPNLTGLTICELASLACAPLALPIDEDNRFDWLLTRDAVWYRDGESVVRYDLGRRAVDWRSKSGPAALGLSIAVRPDETALLVAREAPPSIDLMYAPVARK